MYSVGSPLSPRPIEQLVGTVLNDRWKIAELLPKASFQTGSCFSVGYVVEDSQNSDSKAFAKVLDFSQALQQPDTASALNEMTQSYIFERSLLELCGKHNLTRVVRGLDYGDLARSDVPLGKLFFIVFEIAEGDVRKFVNLNGGGQLSWRVRTLKDIALGLSQLHGKRAFHQDLKPSNVLIFDQGNIAKLGDLGRAHCHGLPAPHDGHSRPGAFHYAPPEQVYDHQMQDTLIYRHAGDMYLLGSMLDFFVTKKPTTVRLIEALDEVHKPFVVRQNGWRGFFVDVLPHLHAAYGTLVHDFSQNLKHLLGLHSQSASAAKLVEEITCLYKYATNPDPLLRGHPRARYMEHQSNFDLQRFISGFEILSRKLALLEKN